MCEVRGLRLTIAKNECKVIAVRYVGDVQSVRHATHELDIAECSVSSQQVLETLSVHHPRHLFCPQHLKSTIGSHMPGHSKEKSVDRAADRSKSDQHLFETCLFLC